MTNLSNSSLQWEVAGAKRQANKKVLGEINGNAGRTINGSAKKDTLSKMPKLETLRKIKKKEFNFIILLKFFFNRKLD